MKRSELKEEIYAQLQLDLSRKDVDQAVQTIISTLNDALITGQRIEIRGFGVFSLRSYKARKGLHPKTGKILLLGNRKIPYFKPSPNLLKVPSKHP